MHLVADQCEGRFDIVKFSRIGIGRRHADAEQVSVEMAGIVMKSDSGRSK